MNKRNFNVVKNNVNNQELAQDMHTCRLPVHEIMKIDCESLATCNQTRYNEEKRGGDIYGKNSKCICTC